MTLDLTCQACDTSFELEISELLDEPLIQCPSCDARAPRATAEALSGVLEDLFGHMGRLRARFGLGFEARSDDLPPPYDRERTAASGEEDEPEEDEDLDLDREADADGE